MQLFEFFGAGMPTVPGVEEIGAKAHVLASLMNASHKIPPGFALSTDYTFLPHDTDSDLMHRVRGGIRRLGDSCSLPWGSELLVSVRAGAPVSMPGILTTIPNVGLGEQTREHLTTTYGEKFSLDCYRRLICGLGKALALSGFDLLVDAAVEFYGDLDAKALTQVVSQGLKLYEDQTGTRFPDNPDEQLRLAVSAVFDSWSSDVARDYRVLEGIDDTIGTGCIVQQMVFGNLNDRSCSGVAFSRNPSTGENTIWGAFVPEAQGDDLVGGSHEGTPIDQMLWPALHQLQEIMPELEAWFDGVVDVEFTVEDGNLYLLQARPARCEPAAEITVALDRAFKGEITREEATELVLAHFQPIDKVTPSGARLGSGVAAFNGTCSGMAAVAPCIKPEAPYVLIANKVTPEIYTLLMGAQGAVFASGSPTSHIAIIARERGIPTVMNVGNLVVEGNVASFGKNTVEHGQLITVDKGEVYCA